MFRGIGFPRVAARALLLLASLALLFFAVQPVAQAQDELFLYLPAVQGPPPPVLHGTVTYAGQPISGISIELWRYSQVDPVLVATTVTGSDGSYQFPDAPALVPPQIYVARFENYANGQVRDERFAAMCHTSMQYSGADPTNLGDFAIDDIAQAMPAHDAVQRLPATFTWTHSAQAAGFYKVLLFPAYGGEEDFLSPEVVGAKTYTLSSLPEGFSYNKTYGWIVIYDADQWYCNSKYSSYVTFKQ